MVAQAIGVGMQVGGGIMRAAGQRKRSKAFTRAAQMNQANVERLAAENAANARFTQGQLDPLAGERGDALSAFLAALGPERSARLGGNQIAAQGVQEGAARDIRGIIRPTPSFENTGAGLSTVLAARRQAAAQAAPGLVRRRLALSHAMLEPQDAAEQGEFSDVIANLVRRSGEATQGAGLRQALAGQRFGTSQQQFLDAMEAAGREGQGLNVAGTLMSNVGSALTGAPQAPAEPARGGGGLGYIPPDVNDRLFYAMGDRGSPY